jgi:hypothetical protein
VAVKKKTVKRAPAEATPSDYQALEARVTQLELLISQSATSLALAKTANSQVTDLRARLWGLYILDYTQINALASLVKPR